MVVLVLPSLDVHVDVYSIRETKVCIVSRCHLDIATQHGVDCLRGCGVNSIESTFMLLQTL